MNEEEKTLIFARHFINDDEGVFAIGKTEIKTLLNLIDRLQRENEDLRILKDDLEDRRFIYTDTPEFEDAYIPKSKIRDKIKELENEIKYEENEKVLVQLGKQKMVLEELLESKNNMCEYCIEGKAICEENRDELGIELQSGAGYLVAYGLDKMNWDISVMAKINFCPMCGRKLIEERVK